MIRILLEILLPLLAPVVVYAVWSHFDARRKGSKMPGWEEGHWFWAVIAGAVLTAASLVWFGAGGDSGRGDYVAPHVQDGKVVPGTFK
jgi:hypothetical protein